MNAIMLRKDVPEKIPFVVGLLLVVLFFPGSTLAHPPGYMGGSMMDQESRENMMEEGRYSYGPGYGWIGGMMGGGYGNMMGGNGPMMGALYQLDLSKEQRASIRDIQRSMRKKNIGLMEKIMDRAAKLEDLYDADKLDPGRIGKAYDELYEVKREMIMRHVEARNKMYEVLNKEQRDKFRSFGYYGHMRGMMN